MDVINIYCGNHFYIYVYIDHFYICVCVCVKSLQSCPTLCDRMDCCPPGFSVHGISQATILEWIAISFSRGSSQPTDQTCLLHLLHRQAGFLPLTPIYIHILTTTTIYIYIRSDQIRSVAQSCPTLCNVMNCSTPGLPVHHQLPEFTQTHVHRVSDAIQPSHPLSSPSPPAANPCQHQSLFQWVNSSH